MAERCKPKENKILGITWGVSDTHDWNIYSAIHDEFQPRARECLKCGLIQNEIGGYLRDRWRDVTREEFDKRLEEILEKENEAIVKIKADLEKRKKSRKTSPNPKTNV